MPKNYCSVSGTGHVRWIAIFLILEIATPKLPWNHLFSENGLSGLNYNVKYAYGK